MGNGKWRKREKFPLASAAAWKHLYLPLAFVSWENSYIFFLDFPTFPLAPPAPVVVAAFFMMFAHSLLVPPRF